ncbi:uncharacterized [Tachysurus ichikawai]
MGLAANGHPSRAGSSGGCGSASKRSFMLLSNQLHFCCPELTMPRSVTEKAGTVRGYILDQRGPLFLGGPLPFNSLLEWVLRSRVLGVSEWDRPLCLIRPVEPNSMGYEGASWSSCICIWPDGAARDPLHRPH